MTEVLTVILVFVLSFFTNYFYGIYVQSIQDRKIVRAAIFGELIVLTTAVNVINYVENRWLLIPIVAGGFLGTFAIRKF